MTSIAEPDAPQRDLSPGGPAPRNPITRSHEPATTRPGAGLRPLVLRLHFWAGLLVAPFILLATISGGLYALSPLVERVVYAEQLTTPSTGPALGVSEQVRAAERVRPDLPVVAVRPATRPAETTRVFFSDPSLTDDRRLAVFVDPVTGASRGSLPVFGSTEALPLRFWLDRLHVDAHLGTPGRIYSETAASWLWIIALAGIVLWWSRTARAPGRWRRFLLGRRDTRPGTRARALGRHGVLGVWLVAGMLFLSATGITWSLFAGENVSTLRSELGWTRPSATKVLPGPEGGAGAAADPHADHAGHSPGAASTSPTGAHEETLRATSVTRLDDAMARAEAQGVNGPVEISVPDQADAPLTVAETRQPWRFGIDSIAFDPATMSVVQQVPFESWPLVAQVIELVINTHMGWQFGLLNQLALAAFALALSVLIVLGYVMWWRRARGRRPGRAPRAVGLGEVNPFVGLTLLGLAIGVGIFLPTVGVGLAAFAVLDLGLAGWRRWRRPTA